MEIRVPVVKTRSANLHHIASFLVQNCSVLRLYCWQTLVFLCIRDGYLFVYAAHYTVGRERGIGRQNRLQQAVSRCK